MASSKFLNSLGQFLQGFGPALVQAGAGVGGRRIDTLSGIALGLGPGFQQVQTGRRRAAITGLADQLNLTPQQRAFLETVNPDVAQTIIGKQLFAAPGKRQVVKDAAGFVRDVQTGERVFPGVEAPKPTSDDIREFLFAKEQGFTGSFIDFMKTVKRAGASSVNVAVDTNAQKKLGETLGIGAGKQLQELIDRGGPAEEMGAAFERAADLLVSGSPTGPVAQLVPAVTAFMNDIGVPIDDIAKKVGVDPSNIAGTAEIARLMTEATVQGFENFKGNLNEREVKIAEGRFARASQGEEANIKALAMGLASAQIASERSIQAAELGADIVGQNKTAVDAFKFMADTRRGGTAELLRRADAIEADLKARFATIGPTSSTLQNSTIDAPLTVEGVSSMSPNQFMQTLRRLKDLPEEQREAIPKPVQDLIIKRIKEMGLVPNG